MNYEVKFTSAFKKSYKLMKKRKMDLDELFFVIDKLRQGKTLDPKYKDHALGGNYDGFRECHIKPDWLLIYHTYLGRYRNSQRLIPEIARLKISKDILSNLLPLTSYFYYAKTPLLFQGEGIFMSKRSQKSRYLHHAAIFRERVFFKNALDKLCHFLKRIPVKIQRGKFVMLAPAPKNSIFTQSVIKLFYKVVYVVVFVNFVGQVYVEIDPHSLKTSHGNFLSVGFKLRAFRDIKVVYIVCEPLERVVVTRKLYINIAGLYLAVFLHKRPATRDFAEIVSLQSLVDRVFKHKTVLRLEPFVQMQTNKHKFTSDDVVRVERITAFGTEFRRIGGVFGFPAALVALVKRYARRFCLTAVGTEFSRI